VIDPLFSLLIPASCRICQRRIEAWGRVPICADCWESVQPYEGAECTRCGYFLQRPVAPGGVLCGLCRRGAFAFDQARSFGWYDKVLRGLIQGLKFDGFLPLARPLAGYLATALDRMQGAAFDLILPVPLHTRRERQRGFNQAALLAKELARACAIPVGSKDCVRVRDTPPQTGLRAAARRKNVTGAFAVPRPEPVRDLRVLLVDDVLTTGATASACAGALQDAGARSVSVLTLARARATWMDVI
jgi:ComF family protein